MKEKVHILQLLNEDAVELKKLKEGLELLMTSGNSVPVTMVSVTSIRKLLDSVKEK